MSDAIEIALISFAGGMISLLAKDMLAPIINYRLTRKESDRKNTIMNKDIVRSYADPILKSSTSLYFRLKKILEDKGRAEFLFPREKQSDYFFYKRLSTTYRLAVLLGWIRAYRRERSWLDPSIKMGEDTIEKKIEKFENILADGAHIELHRLEEITKLWNIKINPNGSSKKDLAIAIDNYISNFMKDKGLFNIFEFQDKDKKDICVGTLNLLNKYLNSNIKIDEIIEKINETMPHFGIKQAWIYRDWQQAIGDMMLIESSNGSRMFEVMSYGDFENICLSVESTFESKRRWISRIDSIFVGFNPHETDFFDARNKQINDIYASCEEIRKGLEEKIRTYQNSIEKTK